MFVKEKNKIKKWFDIVKIKTGRLTCNTIVRNKKYPAEVGISVKHRENANGWRCQKENNN